MEAATRHAVALMREADPDRYVSTLYAPESKRASLSALYAFNAEIAAVRDRIHDPLPGEIRLQWWRDTLQAMGQDGQEATGNPLAEALSRAIRKDDLPVQPFLDMLEARIFDLYDDPMPGRTELEGYCGETASALIQLACLVLDPKAAGETGTLAGHAGCGQAITGLLRLMPLHRRRGQCYVPADLLAAAGTSRKAFLSAEPGDGARRAVAAMTALAREHLSAFENDAARLPSSVLPAFLAPGLASAYLDRIEQGRVDPLAQVAEIGPLHRHWIMFRRATRGWPRRAGR